MIVFPMEDEYIKPSKYDSIYQGDIPAPDLNIKNKRKYNNKPMTRLEELDIQLGYIFRAVEEHRMKIEKDKGFANHEEILNSLEGFINFFKAFNQYASDRCKKDKGCCCQTQHSPERIRYLALIKTHEAWRLLLQVINQRYSPIYSHYLYVVNQNLREHGLLKKSKVFTNGNNPIIYFDKLFSITRYPFHKHPFISVPIDRAMLDGESAICHELGHHVFWNNGEYGEFETRMKHVEELVADTVFPVELPTTKIKNQLKTKKHLELLLEIHGVIASWAEEIIADIYATLLIGPEYAKKAQDMVVRRVVGATNSLKENDSNHPIPILRPYIALKTLKVIHEQLKVSKADMKFKRLLSALIIDLEGRWHDFFATEKISLSEPYQLSRSINISLDELKQYVEEFVVKIVKSPLFYTQESGDKPVSLLVGMEYWGVNSSSDELQEMRKLKKLLLKDTMRNEQSSPALNTDSIESKSKDADGFNDFLEYVKQLSVKGNKKELPCESVMNFEFLVNYLWDECDSRWVHIRQTGYGYYRPCT